MIAFAMVWLVIVIITLLLGLDQTFTDDNGEPIPIIAVLILLPVYWLYYIVPEFMFQKTLGKLITRTSVVTLTGEKPTLKQIILRTICRNIPLEYFSFLVTPAGIHDYLSKTRVIKNSQIKK